MKARPPASWHKCKLSKKSYQQPTWWLFFLGCDRRDPPSIARLLSRPAAPCKWLPGFCCVHRYGVQSLRLLAHSSSSSFVGERTSRRRSSGVKPSASIIEGCRIAIGRLSPLLARRRCSSTLSRRSISRIPTNPFAYAAWLPTWWPSVPCMGLS